QQSMVDLSPLGKRKPISAPLLLVTVSNFYCPQICSILKWISRSIRLIWQSFPIAPGICHRRKSCIDYLLAYAPGPGVLVMQNGTRDLDICISFLIYLLSYYRCTRIA